jgi:hypothetical protein
MTVREFKKVSYLDVPAKLRELADAAEKAQGGGPSFNGVIVVLCYPNGNVAVRGYGEQTSPLQMAGWLARGLTTMSQNFDADTDHVMGDPKPPAA